MRFSYKKKIEIPPDILNRLIELGQKALETRDVPVASVLLHEQEIIGEGFNTVFRNNAAGEHAEVNAVSDAIQKLGFEKFSTLNRDSLILISTFEPCLMCIGLCTNYNITNVFFLQEKERKDLMKERKLFMKYYFFRKQVAHNGEQIALFRMHSDYPKE
ncbi:MAG: deaminase [Bacteroidota bacterium]|nr:deaminase [Bacteroidota bacterium]